MRGRPEHAQPRSNSGRQDRRPQLPRLCFCLFARPASLPPPLQRWPQRLGLPGNSARRCQVMLPPARCVPERLCFGLGCSFLYPVVEGNRPENNTDGAKCVREEGKLRVVLETDAGHCSVTALSHQPSCYLDNTATLNPRQQRKMAESTYRMDLRIEMTQKRKKVRVKRP